MWFRFGLMTLGFSRRSVRVRSLTITQRPTGEGGRAAGVTRRVSREILSLILCALPLIAATPDAAAAQRTIEVPASSGDTVSVTVRVALDIRDSVVVRDSIVVRLRDSVVVRDSLAIRDSVVIMYRDSIVVVYDTVRVEVPPPDENEEPDVPPLVPDSIIAWYPIIDPPERERTMQVGDTVRLTIVGANVTVITEDGRRITRAATLDEIRAAGFYWTHSGMGARRNAALDGTAVTFVSTGLYGSRITHLTLAMPTRSNVWRLVVTNVPRDPGNPLPPDEPVPPDEPDEPAPPPVVCEDYPCDGYESPEVSDSLATAIEFDGVTLHEAGISHGRDPVASYACARILPGAHAAVVGDSILVDQVPPGVDVPERTWCIPYNWPARTAGDPARARTYPAEPNAERAWYGAPGETLPNRSAGTPVPDDDDRLS